MPNSLECIISLIPPEKGHYYFTRNYKEYKNIISCEQLTYPPVVCEVEMDALASVKVKDVRVSATDQGLGSNQLLTELPQDHKHWLPSLIHSLTSHLEQLQ